MIFLFSGSFCFWWKSSGQVCPGHCCFHPKWTAFVLFFPCCLLVSSVLKKPLFLVDCTCRYFLILTFHPGDPHTHTIHGKYLLGLLANRTETLNWRSCAQKHFQALDYHGDTDFTSFWLLTTAPGCSLCKAACFWEPLWWHFWPGVAL